jgi:multidrug resistance efflux pump
MVQGRGRLLRSVRANGRTLALVAVWGGAASLSLALSLGRAQRPTHAATASVVQYSVLAPQDGRLASVTATPGQRVRAGDVLAVVEIPGLDRQIDAAGASVAALEAELRLTALDAERKLARDVDDADARLLAARAALEEARVALAVTRGEAGRVGAAGVGAADGLVAELAAVAAGQEAQLRAREAEVRALTEAARGARRRAEALRGAAEAPAPTQAALDAARAERDALVALREACVVRAHVDGVVSLLPSEVRAGIPTGPPLGVAPGQWVAARTPLFTLTEADSDAAVAYVPAADARDVAAGQAAELVDAEGRIHAAVVVAVGGAVEPTPLRLLRDPSIAEWGVPVTLRVTEAVLTPGEALAYRAGTGAPTALVGVAGPAGAATGGETHGEER